MSQTLGKIVADFETSLATAMAIGATTATLLNATDDDGVALPTGRYFLTLDGNNSQKEHISCTLTGTSLTAIKTLSRQGTETSGCIKAHRVGAKVVLTDFAHIKKINDLLDGTTNFSSTVTLGYDGAPTITTDNQLATKKYADDLAIAGSPDMSLTVKGIGEEATQAEIDAGTQTGGTSAQLVVNPKYLKDSIYYTQLPTSDQKAALAGTGTPSATNKYATADTVVALTPAGTMTMFAGASAPTGWLLCDGSSLLRAGTYATLFGVIGTTFGNADGTHFNVPDMRGRVPIGVGTGTGGGAAGTGLPAGGSALTAVALAGWKGEETHVLSVAELAAHSHSVYDGVSGGGSPQVYDIVPLYGNGNTQPQQYGNPIGMQDTGSNTAHNTIQPVMGVNYIIKY